MNRYRSLSARHTHEKDTRSEIDDLKKADIYREERKRLSNSRISGENGNAIKGSLSKGADKMLGKELSDMLGIDRMFGSQAQNGVETAEKNKK